MIWLFLLLVLDGELVLRNGKVVAYQGEYQKDGSWVRFTSKKGELLQLPLKMVDFEATEARITAKAAKAEADARAKKEAAEKEKVVKKEPQLADLVAEDANTADRSLVIGDNDVDGYVDRRVKYSRAMQRRMEEWQSYRNNSSSQNSLQAMKLKQTLRKGFNQRYQALKDQEKQLEDQLKAARRELREMDRGAPMLTGNDHEDNQIESSHERKIKQKESEIKRLEYSLSVVRQRLDQIDNDRGKLGL